MDIINAQTDMISDIAKLTNDGKEAKNSNDEKKETEKNSNKNAEEKSKNMVKKDSRYKRDVQVRNTGSIGPQTNFKYATKKHRQTMKQLQEDFDMVNI